MSRVKDRAPSEPSRPNPGGLISAGVSFTPRAAAIAAGRTRYHGRPCRHPGHGTERKTANGECVVCWRLRKRRQPDYSHGSRRRKAEARGHAPPPPEHECPPRPADGRCQACGEERVLCLDHCHDTGAFRGWICHPCNLNDVFAETEPPSLTLVTNTANDPPF